MNAALARLLAPLAPLEGTPAWVVGGATRDALRGEVAADVDVAVQGSPEGAASRLTRAHGARRFRLSAEWDSWRVDGGTLPFTVDIMPLLGERLEDDLARRDFTVNAIALALASGELVDPHGGRRDLEQHRLRLVSDAAYRADPVRLVRLVRLARQLALRPDEQALSLARRDAPLLGRAPAERVRDELVRTIKLPEPWRAVEMLDEVRVLGALEPELERARGVEQSPYHHQDVLGHVMEVVEHTARLTADPEPVFREHAPRMLDRLGEPLADDLDRGQALLLAALLHDIAKPATMALTAEGRVTFMGHDRLGAEMSEAWCVRYRTSRRLRAFVANLVREHLVLGFMVHRQPLSLRQIDRALRRIAPEQVEQAVLSCADRLATRGPRTSEASIRRHLVLVREMVGWHFTLVDRGPVRPAATGDAIARAVGREPGPWLADLLDLLREERLLGRINTESEAIRFAETWLSGAGMGGIDHDPPPASR
jgi:putative nucleotidyltransferase with HDIG domain